MSKYTEIRELALSKKPTKLKELLGEALIEKITALKEEVKPEAAEGLFTSANNRFVVSKDNLDEVMAPQSEVDRRMMGLHPVQVTQKLNTPDGQMHGKVNKAPARRADATLLPPGPQAERDRLDDEVRRERPQDFDPSHVVTSDDLTGPMHTDRADLLNKTGDVPGLNQLGIMPAVASEEVLDEGAITKNEGWGYHGEMLTKHGDDMKKAGRAYSSMHSKVKKIAGEAGHLRDVAKPNVMVRDYLDSRHGRHLADAESFDNASGRELHPYITKDFGKFKKSYVNEETLEEIFNIDTASKKDLWDEHARRSTAKASSGKELANKIHTCVSEKYGKDCAEDMKKHSTISEVAKTARVSDKSEFENYLKHLRAKHGVE